MQCTVLPHITASVFINDDERGSHADYEKWLEALAPHSTSPRTEYRRRGLAQYILGTSLRRAAENHHEKMVLEVDITNQAAVGLYHTLGFKTVKGSESYIWEK